jgi:hypothetical protein
VRTTTTTVEEGPGGVVTLRPPVERTEVIPVAPDDRAVWDAGRWSWNGSSYVWVGGHYVERPYPQSVWVAGRWVDHGDGWVWEEGHWRA